MIPSMAQDSTDVQKYGADEKELIQSRSKNSALILLQLFREPCVSGAYSMRRVLRHWVAGEIHRANSNEK